jgi:hypothetical protein
MNGSRFHQHNADGSGFCFAKTQTGNGTNKDYIRLKHMKTHTNLKPGLKGTKRLVEQYGKVILCVRYRLDTIRGIRMKTVELVVEEKTVPSLHA